jgi:hypothetical protein
MRTLQQAEEDLLRANRERERDRTSAEQRISSRRISSEEQKRLYDLECRGAKPLLSDRAYRN